MERNLRLIGIMYFGGKHIGYMFYDKYSNNIMSLRGGVWRNSKLANIAVGADGRVVCFECALSNFAKFELDSSNEFKPLGTERSLYVIGRIYKQSQFEGYKVFFSNGIIRDLSLDTIKGLTQSGYKLVNMHFNKAGTALVANKKDTLFQFGDYLDVKIRYLRYSDLQRLEQFLDKVNEAGDFILNIDIDEARDLLSDKGQNYLIGCFDGHKMVGVATVGGADILNKVGYLLSDVYVLKEYRGSGCASKLVKFVQSKVDSILWIELLDLKLGRFYSKFGFKPLNDGYIMYYSKS